MPRTARMKELSLVYHITQRGNNKEKVFESNEEKHLLLDIIFSARVLYKFYIYAYCIMDNHYHLLINNNESDISIIMKYINNKYAKYYNKIYKRSGHVFQERFFSEIICSDVHLFNEINYIHDNPVRAGVTTRQEEYKWSSCQ